MRRPDAAGSGKPDSLALSVRDTGIGIPGDRLGLIFEAFQQADGTTSRRFGGTGLGLSISAEIAKLLGGEIHVESIVDVGSTFTLSLPIQFARADGDGHADVPSASAARQLPQETGAGLLLQRELDDDRDSLSPNDRVLLIVEDDPVFAKLLLGSAHDAGFKGVVAQRGDTGFSLAHACRPDAILLDMGLPVMDGSQLLARLKMHPATRDIPVHVISGVLGDAGPDHAGVVSTLEKPASLEELAALFQGIASTPPQGAAKVLLVERPGDGHGAIRDLLAALGEVQVTSVGSARAAVSALESDEFACVVLDAKLPRSGAFSFLDKLEAADRLDHLPVIVHESEPLTAAEEERLAAHADKVVVVATRTPERLLEEAAAFLGDVRAGLGENGRPAASGEAVAESFEGRRALVVDDDI